MTNPLDSKKALGSLTHRELEILDLCAQHLNSKDIARKLDARGIDFYIFHEPDDDMGHSAICTRPITDHRERAIFRKWDLFKHAD